MEKRKQRRYSKEVLGLDLLEGCGSRPGALVVSAMGGLGDELWRTLHLAGNGAVARKGQAVVLEAETLTAGPGGVYEALHQMGG